MKVYVDGRAIDLLNDHYKAEGGFARVFVKNGCAYKVYHDPKNMIPPAKIRELSQLKLANVLAPQKVIEDKNGKPIGFTMPSIDKSEFLIKLFSKGFRNRNKISPTDIVDLVTVKQKTLQEIHDQQFLVVDYNPMNFLIDPNFKTPFFIDVDSYQTPSFTATALMDSVRDRKGVRNQFTEFTDWFSWAIVAFQLYIGVHPYGGDHPNFTGQGFLDARMDANVSVFDKAVSLPPACQDFAVIPKAHFEWFKRVFVNGERSIPPLPDGLVVAIPKARIIAGNERFEIKEVASFKDSLEGVEVINGSRYYLTDGGIYQEAKEILSFSSRDKVRSIVPVQGDVFVVAEYNKPTGLVLFADKTKTQIGAIASDSFTTVNGCIYTISNDKLVENSFINLGKKVIHQTDIVGNVFAPTAKLFNGVVIQDMLGQISAVIPKQRGSSIEEKLPEMNGYRIVDAKYSRNFLVALAEKGGEYTRFIYHFAPRQRTLRTDVNCDLDTINFTVFDNGLCIMVVGDKRVEAFFGNASVKVIQKPPFDSEDPLYSEGNVAMIVKDTKLYKISLK